MAGQEAQQKLEQLSLLEKSNQALFMQKQQFQSQLLEIMNALKELETAPTAYKQVGNILVLADIQALQEELKGKKEMIELRISTLEKQETQIREKAKRLQEEIIGSMGSDEDGAEKQ